MKQDSPIAAHFHWLDRAAIGLSGLCVVHCVGTALIVALIASAGSIFLNPVIHETGLALAMTIGVVSLGRGSLIHGFMLPSAMGALGMGIMAGALSMPEGGNEAVFTILGVAVVALGHDLNRRALN